MLAGQIFKQCAPRAQEAPETFSSEETGSHYSFKKITG